MRKFIWLIVLCILAIPSFAQQTHNIDVFASITNFVKDPTTAYILMLIAFYGLFFEFANPGGILPGLIGLIALVLALYGFHYLPVNYAALSLIMVGLGFMLFEAYTAFYGIAGVLGIIAFIVGSMILYDRQHQNSHLTWTVILLMGVITVLFFLVVATVVIRSQKKSVVTGAEGLIGSEGTVVSVMNKQIIVRVGGELWEAHSAYEINPNDKVKITHVHGLHLTVTPVKDE